MVDWSIEACREAPSVRSVIVACPPGHVHDLAGQDIGVVDGGETRSASVSNALAAVGTELVAIHDAARPLLTAGILEAVIAALMEDIEAAGAIAAVPVADTVKRVAAEASPVAERSPVAEGPLIIESTVDRGGLWAAQTPQVFWASRLREALGADPDAVAAATDEAMLVEAAGGKVLIHPSSAENLKVTTPQDLRVAELLLSDRAQRQATAEMEP
jgi:2-C-methyl-D-erythritol 4-phosphate cytidylyltransferase